MGCGMELRGKLIDLHIHLDGSLSEQCVRDLADMQGVHIEGNLLEKLQVSADCADLNEYLEKFEFPLELLQTKEALTYSVRELLKEQYAQGIIYTEVRFAPQLHMRQGLTQNEVIEAVLEGRIQGEDITKSVSKNEQRDGIKSGIILCCMRGDNNQAANEETVRLAKEFLGKGVVAVDLAGAEALFPTENFCGLFELARELKVPFTIHAGEAAGSESIIKALEYGAKRIGHGIRAAWDDELIKKLADESIYLELCPTSNLNTKVVERLADYPIRKLMDAGVKVTINTDNMTVSGTTLLHEFNLVMEKCGISEEQIRDILVNSIEATFATEDIKNYLREQVVAGE